MSTLDKLIARMRRNPQAVRFEEVERVLAVAGYSLARTSGSHQVYRPDNGVGDSLVVVRPHGGRQFVSPAAVRDVLALIEAKLARDEE